MPACYIVYNHHDYDDHDYIYDHNDYDHRSDCDHHDHDPGGAGSNGSL